MTADPARLYRALFCDGWPKASQYDSADEIRSSDTAIILNRTKASHRGVGRHHRLRALFAGAVNQDFLEEIGCLGQLEHVELGWPTTANDPAPIGRLGNLRVLKIDSPRNIADFSFVARLPRLECLFIENAKHMADLEWIRPLRDRLKVLGIEGSLYTIQRLPSLTPLEGFDLEALFLTSTRLEDQSLQPLHRMRSLEYLGTALNAPRREFEALQSALPTLQCDWFDPKMWEQFRDPRPPKRP